MIDSDRLDALEQRFARLEQEHASLLATFFSPPAPDRFSELQTTLSLTPAALDQRITEMAAGGSGDALFQCELGGSAARCSPTSPASCWRPRPDVRPSCRWSGPRRATCPRSTRSCGR